MAEVTPTESEIKGSSTQSKERIVIIPAEVKRGTTEMVWYQLKAQLQQKEKMLDDRIGNQVEQHAGYASLASERDLLNEVIDAKTDQLFLARKGSLTDKYIPGPEQSISARYKVFRGEARKMGCDEAASFLDQIRQKYEKELAEAKDEDAKVSALFDLKATDSLALRLGAEEGNSPKAVPHKPIVSEKATPKVAEQQKVDEVREVLHEETAKAVIREVLQKGSFMVHFAMIELVDQDGKGTWSGFRPLYSRGSSAEVWKKNGQGIIDPLANIIPEAYDRGYLDSEVGGFLATQTITEAVCVRSEYKKITKPVQHETIRQVPGFFGAKEVKSTYTEEKFVANEPVLFPGTAEQMVHLTYQTIVEKAYAKEADITRMYTDENGRPGNVFGLELYVPMSEAKKIVQQGEADPGFYRELAKSAVLDREVGVTANPDQHLKFREDAKNIGLPDYENEAWKKSKMLVSTRLTVPQDDEHAQDYSHLSHQNKVIMAKQRMQRLTVTPK